MTAHAPSTNLDMVLAERIEETRGQADSILALKSANRKRLALHRSLIEQALTALPSDLTERIYPPADNDGSFAWNLAAKHHAHGWRSIRFVVATPMAIVIHGLVISDRQIRPSESENEISALTSIMATTMTRIITGIEATPPVSRAQANGQMPISPLQRHPSIEPHLDHALAKANSALLKASKLLDCKVPIQIRRMPSLQPGAVRIGIEGLEQTTLCYVTEPTGGGKYIQISMPDPRDLRADSLDISQPNQETVAIQIIELHVANCFEGALSQLRMMAMNSI